MPTDCPNCMPEVPRAAMHSAPVSGNLPVLNRSFRFTGHRRRIVGARDHAFVALHAAGSGAVLDGPVQRCLAGPYGAESDLPWRVSPVHVPLPAFARFGSDFRPKLMEPECLPFRVLPHGVVAAAPRGITDWRCGSPLGSGFRSSSRSAGRCLVLPGAPPCRSVSGPPAQPEIGC